MSDEEDIKTLGTELIDTLDDCIVRIYRSIAETHKFSNDVFTDDELCNLWNTIRQLVLAISAAQANYGTQPVLIHEYAAEAAKHLDKLSNILEST